MKLCMFTPRDRDLDRGWPGRLEDDRIVQLAAQTLQAFFTGGGSAREHDEYWLADCVLRAPVLHPGAVRLYDGDDFVFGNPSCIYGPDEPVPMPVGASAVEAQLRVVAVVGAATIGGFTLMNDWLAPELPGIKARDFAYSLGPVVATPDEYEYDAEWHRLVDHAELNTRLYPGDLIAGPVLDRAGPFGVGDAVELSLDAIGSLQTYVAAPA